VNARNPLDDSSYPPFEGFPREALSFLRKLKRNNNRPWFQAHRTEYEECVRFPMQTLIADLPGTWPAWHRRSSSIPSGRSSGSTGCPLQHQQGPLQDQHRGQLRGPLRRRPHGDSRAVRGDRAGGDLGRRRIVHADGSAAEGNPPFDREEPEGWLAVVEAPRFRKVFGGIDGEKLSRAPLGYPADHPMIEHLKTQTIVRRRRPG